MGAVVDLVAGIGFEMNGHRSVGADGQRVNQLLEIGAMVFAEAPAQLDRFGVLVRVGAAEFDGGRIVVNLAGAKIKGLGRMHHQRGHQAGAVTLEEPVQSPAQSVIAQVLGGPQGRVILLRPSLNPVEGIGLKKDAFDQQLQGIDIVGGLDLLAQQRAQVQSPQEVVHEGQSPLQFFSQRKRLDLHRAQS